MKITDEILMAYADHEVDAATAAEVEAALAADSALAARVAELRRQRERLHAAFDLVLQEAVPPRVLAAAQGVRAIRPRRRWGWPELSGMAASLALGAVAALVALRLPPEPTMLAGAGGLVARGVLARSLSEALSAEPGDGPVRIGVSFRDRSGAYCRTFVTAQPAGMAGLACRQADDWQLLIVTEAAARGAATPYRMAAGAIPPEVLQAVEDRIAGPPLDAESESAARARGWVD